MHRVRIILATGLIAAAVAGAAIAAEAPVDSYVMSDANAGAAPIRGDRVYKAFHGLEGISRIVRRLDRFHNEDPRLAEFFKAADHERLQRTLTEQFCYLLGGPCHYSGRDMKALHTDMGVQVSTLNAQIEDLQKAMDEERVPVWAQNRLLARLAPLERVIVTR